MRFHIIVMWQQVEVAESEGVIVKNNLEHINWEKKKSRPYTVSL